MFEYMRYHKVGAELESVTFKAGDWTGPYDGPLRLEGFLDDRRVMVTCRVDADQNVCNVTERG
jgi:hypothetical protein